jgi:glycine cleavage system transcriptional repressor
MSCVPHYAVIAIGADRPGIVAGLTAALLEHGANLEDVSSSILRGYFAIMLVVDVPDSPGAEPLQASLEAAARPLGVSVFVRDVEAAAPRRTHATHALVAYGADRPGIVAGLAALLADRGVNVADLSCRLTGEDPPVYVLVAEVTVPDGVEAGALGAEIGARAKELGVDVTFSPIEADTL